MMRNVLKRIGLALLLLPLWMQPMAARADRDDRGPGADFRGHGPGEYRRFDRGPGPEWHGDIPRFREHDFDRWRGGRWYHGFHEGHLGWWWIVNGLWYFYPHRAYPNPYIPPYQSAPSANLWYYCSDPPGYYPYVQWCEVPWQVVPANPY
ncbi:MAG: hypothetical protein M0T84_17555 [Betaproteobacteria bacterium]|nr:hypothetical protein [Betaproteobacteria bacterium]